MAPMKSRLLLASLAVLLVAAAAHQRFESSRIIQVSLRGDPAVGASSSPPPTDDADASPLSEEAVDASNQTGAIMLVGAIAFQMVLYYLVNWPDEDIQYYSYNTIAMSISIFSAVLAYSGVNNCLRTYLLPSLGPHGALPLAACHFIFWFIFLQVLTARLSGAIWTKEVPSPKEVPAGPEREEVKEIWEQREMNIKCWAGMFTHVAAFAAINAFGELQQLPFFASSPWTAVLVVPAGLVCTILLARLSDTVRYWIAMAGDGEISKSEELWDEEAEEAENDIIALALSFCTLQAIRFAVSGALPALAGDADDDAVNVGLFGAGARHTCLCLSLIGVGMVLLTLVLGFLKNHLYKHRKEYEGLDKRAMLIGTLFSSMLFAWCVLFASKAGAGYFLSNMPVMLQTVAVALFVSFLSFGAIFILDKIADQSEERSDLLEMLICLIESHGLLVGLGWEASFDVAIDTMCDGFGNSAAIFNLILSLCICAIVVPANWLYILPAVEREKKEARGGSEGSSEGSDEEEEEGEHGHKEHGHAEHGHAEHGHAEHGEQKAVHAH